MYLHMYVCTYDAVIIIRRYHYSKNRTYVYKYMYLMTQLVINDHICVPYIRSTFKLYMNIATFLAWLHNYYNINICS